MLNKKEKAVFLVILDFLSNKRTCLITIEQILQKVDVKYRLDKDAVSKIIDELSFDGYIESFVSLSKDKTFYCISLLKKGDGFHREEKQNKRTIVKKAIVTVGAAVLSFIITLILKSIFS